jgi:hypothetical protein
MSSVRITLINALEAIPQIERISTSNFEPQHQAKAVEMITRIEWPGKSPDEKIVFNVIPIDNQFAEILRLRMQMGEWYWEQNRAQRRSRSCNGAP